MPDITTIVKVGVNLSISFPIMLRMYIISKNNGVSWIDSRYEKLPLFYFIVGIWGIVRSIAQNLHLIAIV